MLEKHKDGEPIGDVSDRDLQVENDVCISGQRSLMLRVKSSL